MVAPSRSSAAEKAKQCLAKAAPIPGYPLYNMGAVALWDSKSDFELLQNAVDYLTCKAKANMPFTEDEKQFMIDLFSDMSLGGRVKGYSEAAQLVRHYVTGKGAKLQIDAAVYKTSAVVKDVSEAIKDYVRQQVAKKAAFAVVRATDPGFRVSPQAAGVSRRSGRDVQRQGYLLDDGNLLTEQSNARLKNANNRFILVAQNTMVSGAKAVQTRWSVDDRYTFEPFEKADFYTNIPLSSAQILNLPDGLSYYMTVLGIASEFDYWAAWMETWNV